MSHCPERRRHHGVRVAARTDLPSPFLGLNVGLFRAGRGRASEALVGRIAAAPGGGLILGTADPALSNRDEVAFSGLVESQFGQ